MPSPRSRSPLGRAAVVAVAALLGVVGCESLASSSPSVGADATGPGAGAAPSGPGVSTGVPAARPPRLPSADLGQADGEVPEGTTVFDREVPAVGNLDPELLAALRAAAEAAGDDGVTFEVNSGWRSAGYQEQLLRDAVSRYGSLEEAARWVATPTTSAHVTGDAVDLGGAGTTEWLERYGAGYGLCPVYGNEPWHFERRSDAPHAGCPPRYADPTQDPRMQP